MTLICARFSRINSVYPTLSCIIDKGQMFHNLNHFKFIYRTSSLNIYIADSVIMPLRYDDLLILLRG